MQFVKCGKIYDTETAAVVWRKSSSSLENSSEVLYLSQKGSAFLVTTSFVDEVPKVELLSCDEAQHWLDGAAAPPTSYEALGIELQEG